MKTVRVVFKCEKVSLAIYGNEIVLSRVPRYGDNDIEEFRKIPQGSLTIRTDDKEIVNGFIVGEEYVIDINDTHKQTIKPCKTKGHYSEKYGIGVMYKDGKQYMQINPEHVLVFRNCPILTEDGSGIRYYVRFEDIPSTIE